MEELPAQASVTTVIAVPGVEDEQIFSTSARYGAHWVHRPMDAADQAQEILKTLASINIEDGTFVWVGAEARVAKAVRQYLLESRKVPLQWIKASGYWVKGQADATVKDVGAI